MIPERIKQELDKYSLTDIHEYIHERTLRTEESHTEEESDTYTETEFSNTDTSDPDDYYEELCVIVDTCIQKNASLFKEYKYIEKFKKVITEYIHEEEEDIEYVFTYDTLHELLDIILSTFIGGQYPLRSTETYEPTLSPQEIESMTSQITWIRNQPQPDQRTPDWYKFRHDLITASSAWKLLDTPAQQNSYVYAKCQPLDISKFQRTSLDSPFHWGQKYEPLSVLYYEWKYKTTIEDFGCIRHATDHHMGASPDGINVNPSSCRYGRMLEIKNIVNRDITGIPKKEYWIQMQLQMEVCQLNECDFLECRFKEYESQEAFEKDGTWERTEEGHPKGVFLMFNHADENHQYEYPPWGLSKQEWEAWEETTIQRMEEQGWHWLQTIYWRMPEVSCVLVERNPYWYASVKDEFAKWWKVIEEERVSGCDHRMSKKRRENKANKEKRKNTDSQETKLPSIMTIFTDDL